MTDRTKCFVSYSHVDQEWRQRLETHLAVLERKGLIEVWADTRIGVGDDWKAAIDAELQACDVAILLVTANFLASAFIQEVEVQRLVLAHESSGLFVMPVIAQPCAWRLVDWLAGRQCWPRGGRAMSLSPDPEIDRDLAGITYELAMRLGQAPAPAADDLAMLSGTRSSGTTRLSDAGTRVNFTGRSWEGRYASTYGPSDRAMWLTIASQHGDSFHGRAGFDRTSVSVEGEIVHIQSEPGDGSTAWDDVRAAARRPLHTLRFTDSEADGPDLLETGGDYRAVVQADGAIVGLWYSTEDASTPVGRFDLAPGAARRDRTAAGA